MNARPTLRCAIYTRVSTEHGLDQGFNSLDNQREAAEAYIKSQAQEGWRLIRDRFDDGGFSGGSLDRPALQNLLADIQARRIDVVIVYKVDRLTRSLADLAKLVELFDGHGVSFVSVTQAFNTTTSMGRLTLNVLLSFAQFEREVTGERIRDKIAASKKKGIWMGGVVPLGYRVEARALHIVEKHAELIRTIFGRYRELGSVSALKDSLDQDAILIPERTDGAGRHTGGKPFSRGRSLIPAQKQPDSDADLLVQHCKNVRVEAECLSITRSDDQRIEVAWTPPPSRRRREIIVPSGSSKNQRPMKAEDRTRILRAIAKARSWMGELTSSAIGSTDAIANRENLTERSVRMTLSLSFLAPAIVKAIVDGRLPRGIGLKTLVDLPASWAEQERALGL